MRPEDKVRVDERLSVQTSGGMTMSEESIELNRVAKMFADCISDSGRDTQNLLHAYEDGYVVSVACSPRRHSHIYEALQKQWPRIGEGRSSDGFISVFVIPDSRAATAGDFAPLLVLVTDALVDHRQRDTGTISISAECIANGFPVIV
jgi:hypothetical protein